MEFFMLNGLDPQYYKCYFPLSKMSFPSRTSNHHGSAPRLFDRTPANSIFSSSPFTHLSFGAEEGFGEDMNGEVTGEQPWGWEEMRCLQA